MDRLVESIFNNISYDNGVTFTGSKLHIDPVEKADLAILTNPLTVDRIHHKRAVCTPGSRRLLGLSSARSSIIDLTEGRRIALGSYEIMFHPAGVMPGVVAVQMCSGAASCLYLSHFSLLPSSFAAPLPRLNVSALVVDMDRVIQEQTTESRETVINEVIELLHELKGCRVAVVQDIAAGLELVYAMSPVSTVHLSPALMSGVATLKRGGLEFAARVRPRRDGAETLSLICSAEVAALDLSNCATIGFDDRVAYDHHFQPFNRPDMRQLEEVVKRHIPAPSLFFVSSRIKELSTCRERFPMARWLDKTRQLVLL